ncbi:unnamed protein product [marine sediment metagenome]|uniref:Uncharacterized protein n=1 Tax=marine sediment metagenome TaxID=412755 RepID=X0ZZB8_9ZZZZ
MTAFVHDKINELVTIVPKEKFIGRLVWLTPENYSTRVLTFSSTFSDKEISYNVVKID